MTSTTPIKKFLKVFLVLCFWILVWQIISMAVGIELLVPSPLVTLKTWLGLVVTKIFWLSAIYSLLRILLGFLLAVVFGCVLGFATYKFGILKTLLSPILHIISAVPVVSFIILALVWIKTDTLPIFISFLMVLPMIWQTVFGALSQIDKKLIEMARVYKFKKTKVFSKIVIPSIIPPFITSCITGLGFSWKSGIAAEVLCLPKIAIGKQLFNSKIYLETAEVFAWTITIIILSILFETVLKFAIKKYTTSYRKDGANIAD